MPLTTVTVECPRCAVAFLAPDVSASNRVQCPNCAGQNPLESCRRVGAEGIRQRGIDAIRSEREEKAGILEFAGVRQTKLLLGIGIGVVAVGLGSYAAVSLGFGRAVAENEWELERVARVSAEEKARFDGAFAAARRALAQPDWRMLLQGARARERVLPMAQWVYGRVPYEPLLLTGYQFPEDMMVGEDAFVRFYVRAEEVESGFWLRLQNSGYGWLLDWEALGHHTREHWNAFVRERPALAGEYRVHIQRSSVPDRHFFARGFTGESDAFGVRIWALDPENAVHAVVPAGSAAESGLADTVRWEVEEGYIVRMKWPEGATTVGGYDFVDLLDVVQQGWHVTDPPRAARRSAAGG